MLTRHPFLAALVVFTAVAGPTLWWVADVAEEAHETAAGFAEAELREDLEEATEAVEACRVRNRGTLNDRLRFDALFATLERLFPESDEVDELRATVPADPGIEDRDCDGNGQLTDADYAP